mgnify:CR=1 FL=1
MGVFRLKYLWKSKIKTGKEQEIKIDKGFVPGMGQWKTPSWNSVQHKLIIYMTKYLHSLGIEKQKRFFTLVTGTHSIQFDLTLLSWSSLAQGTIVHSEEKNESSSNSWFSGKATRFCHDLLWWMWQYIWRQRWWWTSSCVVHEEPISSRNRRYVCNKVLWMKQFDTCNVRFSCQVLDFIFWKY